MAKKKFKVEMKMVGIVLVVVGLGLAYWGYHISGSMESQLNRTFNSSFTQAELIRYIGGAVSALAGIYLYIKN